jgi:hypothetical protein
MKNLMILFENVKDFYLIAQNYEGFYIKKRMKKELCGLNVE